MRTETLLEEVSGDVEVGLKPHDTTHCIISKAGEAVDLEVWPHEVYLDGMKCSGNIQDRFSLGTCRLADYEVVDAPGCKKVTLWFESTERELTEAEKSALKVMR